MWRYIKHHIYKPLFLNLIMAETKISKEEEIGFHKGAIQTLVNERNEIVRIIQVTESLIGQHLQALEKLGVKIEKKESK